jgi:hypothetical protein
MLDKEAAAGKLEGIKNVEGAAESGIEGVRSGDYRFTLSNGKVVAGDLISTTSTSRQSVMGKILKKANQAERIVVDVLPNASNQMLSEADAIGAASDALMTSLKIKQVIIVREGKVIANVSVR